MKKLLGIVVLGLLWCNVGYSKIIQLECSGFTGKGSLDKNTMNKPFKLKFDTKNKTYEFSIQDNIWKKMQVLEWYEDSVKAKVPVSSGSIEIFNWKNYKQYLFNPDDGSKVEDGYIQNHCVPDSKIEIASMIDEAKDTCKELGFTEGTDKFADCSLKLYSQSVELAAKNNQTVVMQPQSSGSNSITIYDPVRDSNALIRQGQRMLSGACTLGFNC